MDEDDKTDGVTIRDSIGRDQTPVVIDESGVYSLVFSSKLESAISNLKLQKVLYFIQAEFLVVQNTPCFVEQIEAWDFGPVVPVVYYRYRIYGGAAIPLPHDDGFCPFNKRDKKLADGVIDECAKYSAAELTDIVHRQTTWREAYRRRGIIINESLKEFFKGETDERSKDF